MKTRTSYINFSPETIEQARQIDLLTYLSIYEPDNLVCITSNVYCTREHDSLKISNGKWVRLVLLQVFKDEKGAEM